jgi:hypothetical protein
VRRFDLIDSRGEERTVAEGCECGDGTVFVRWLGESPSSVIWDDFGHFEAVSVGGHDHSGRMTRRVEWRDE